MAQLDDAALYEAFDSDPEPVVAFLQWIATAKQLTPQPQLLDVGCGPGRLFRPLTDLGWEVVGLEPDAAFRERAAERGRRLGVSVMEGTFNTVAPTKGYDLIVGINSVFAHIVPPAERADALLRCRSALREPGILVLDLPNTLKILFEYRKPEPQVVSLGDHRVTRTRDHTIDYGAATFVTDERYDVSSPDGYTRTVRKRHVYAITTWPDLAYLISRAGFSQCEVYDGFTERAPSNGNGRRLLIVASAT
jgi:SAM-dependent methyltransferase